MPDRRASGRSRGSTAVAADPDRDVVSVVDLASRKVTAQYTLQPGDEPGRLVEDSDHRVHVALRSGGALVTFDLGSSASGDPLINGELHLRWAPNSATSSR